MKVLDVYLVNVNFFNGSIFIAVIIEVTFALLLFFGRKKNQVANRFLSLMLLIIAAWMFWTVSLGLGLNSYFPILNVIPFTYSLAMGPAIYFYVKKLCQPQVKLSKATLWHFLPVCFELLVHFTNVVVADAQGIAFKKTFIFLTVYPLIQLASIASIATYIYYSFRLLKQFDVFLKNNFSDYVKYQLLWLRRLLVVFICYELCWLPYTLVDYLLFDFKLSIESYYPLHMMISIIGIWLAVESFLNPDSLVDQTLTNKNDDELAASEQKISSQENKTLNWLVEEMEQQHYYLDADLNLSTLAKALDLHPNLLSRLLNKGLDKCFADFVNEYRINAVIIKLADNKYQQMTLLDIAFNSGFNSKTTFNRIFKKFTGDTPLNYRKTLKNNEQQLAI